jgi:hypothetical protein
VPARRWPMRGDHTYPLIASSRCLKPVACRTSVGRQRRSPGWSSSRAPGDCPESPHSLRCCWPVTPGCWQAMLSLAKRRPADHWHACRRGSKQPGVDLLICIGPSLQDRSVVSLRRDNVHDQFRVAAELHRLGRTHRRRQSQSLQVRSPPACCQHRKATTGVPQASASGIARPNCSGQVIGNTRAAARPRNSPRSRLPSSPTSSKCGPSSGGGTTS